MKNQFDGRTFRVTLRIWRKMHGFTVAEAAALVDMAASTYSFVETGDRAPDMAQFSRLCQIMEFPASDFFNTLESVKNG